MKLLLSLTAATCILRTTLPGPGSYWLMSSDGHGHTRVEASGYAFEACHVAVSLSRTNSHRIFTVRFDPEPKL